MIVGSCLGFEKAGYRSVREGCLLVIWENLDRRKGKEGKKGRRGRSGVLFVVSDTKSKILSFHSRSWLYEINVHEEQTD